MSRSWSMVLAVALVSCGGVTPSGRAAVITYSGCGDAFGGEVAAIVVGPELAVTVAHGVAQADTIEVEWAETGHQGRVVAYSSRSDLALVAIPGLEADAVRFGVPVRGNEVRLVGGLTTRELALAVDDTLTIRIEEVLGTERVEREGVKLTGDAAVGDSGGGLFDGNDALVGIVFAVSDDRSREVWATAASEITALLDGADGEWGCDPARSRLVDTGQG